MVAMLAVVSGHVWPAQLGFRGGKGVATSLGALSVYDVHLASALLMLFGVGVLLMRRTVLAGLFAFACLPFVSKYLGDDRPKVVGISVLAGLVLLAHRKNLTEEFSHFMEHRHIHSEHDHSEL
jgi:glycerol-3-phosphate acyltransferase PlsY